MRRCSVIVKRCHRSTGTVRLIDEQVFTKHLTVTYSSGDLKTACLRVL